MPVVQIRMTLIDLSAHWTKLSTTQSTDSWASYFINSNFHTPKYSCTLLLPMLPV